MRTPSSRPAIGSSTTAESPSASLSGAGMSAAIQRAFRTLVLPTIVALGQGACILQQADQDDQYRAPAPAPARPVPEQLPNATACSQLIAASPVRLSDETAVFDGQKGINEWTITFAGSGLSQEVFKRCGPIRMDLATLLDGRPDYTQIVASTTYPQYLGFDTVALQQKWRPGALQGKEICYGERATAFEGSLQIADTNPLVAFPRNPQ